MEFSEAMKNIDQQMGVRHKLIQTDSMIEIYNVDNQGNVDQEVFYRISPIKPFFTVRISRGTETGKASFNSFVEAEIQLFIVLIKKVLPHRDAYSQLISKKKYSFFVKHTFNKLFPGERVFSENGEIAGTLFLKEATGMFELYYRGQNGDSTRLKREAMSEYGKALYTASLEANAIYASKLLIKYSQKEFSPSVVEQILMKEFLNKKTLPISKLTESMLNA